MEFEYTGTIYIDTDDIFEKCREHNSIDTDDIYKEVNDYIISLDDSIYYCVEGWMIDKVVTEIKKRVDKELNS